MPAARWPRRRSTETRCSPNHQNSAPAAPKRRTCSPPRKTLRHTRCAPPPSIPPPLRPKKILSNESAQREGARQPHPLWLGSAIERFRGGQHQRDRQRGKHRDKQHQRKLYRNEVSVGLIGVVARGPVRPVI